METRYEDTGEGMSMQQLIDEIKVLFIASHETTANALTFTLHFLGRYPEIQQKKFDEKGEYIRKWIPEFDFGYNEPMVDHAFARDRAIATYKAGILK